VIGSIRLDLADNCNVRCIMCQAYNSTPVKSTKYLDFELFRKNTAGQLKNFATIQLGNIAEPLFHPQFPDILRFIRSENAYANIHIVTNGKLLVRHIGVINEVGGCTIQISMDSLDKKTHEYIREGSDFSLVEAGLKRIDRSKTKVLLSFTLMNSNIREYNDILEYCRANDFRMACFPMILRTEGSVIPFNLVRESLWFNAPVLREWLKQYYGADYGAMVIGAATGNAPAAFAANVCNAHKTDLIVDALGNTTLCYKENLGKVTELTLSEMWFGTKAVAFRERVDRDRSPCQVCDYYRSCLMPSMSLLANHVARDIFRALSPAVKNALSLDREISADEARRLFVNDLKNKFGFFEIERNKHTHRAWRVTGIDAVGAPIMTGPALEASSRHELHSLMVAASPQFSKVITRDTGQRINILQYQDNYFGLPRTLGPVNVTVDFDQLPKGVLVGESMDEVTRLIAAACLSEDTTTPLLVESYQDCNIVRYQNRYWGIPVCLGPFDLTVASNQTCVGVIFEESIEAIRNAIDQTRDPTPVLLRSLTEYNVVRYRDTFFGVPVCLGPLDLNIAENQKLDGIIIERSEEALNRELEAFDGSVNTPKSVGQLGPYNICSYMFYIVAVPMAYGPFDTRDPNLPARAGVIRANSIKELEKQIFWNAGTAHQLGLKCS
jgi:radical SAM protein with 4Fe4S-binding SPASM domain